MTQQQSDHEALFNEYLRVCNAALECHKHCFPYNRILYQVEELLKDHAVQVAIYEEDEENPVKRHDMILLKGKLAVKAPHRPYARRPWRLSRYFLEQVASNPDSYIHNPAQLNWKWLTDHGIGI